MLFALTAATMFSSCNKDDDDDDNQGMASLYATGDIEFDGTAAAKFTTNNSADATGSKFSLGKLLSSSESKTSIFGFDKNKAGMYITLNGTASGTTYKFGFNAQTDGTQLLIDYLTTGDAKQTLSDAIEANTGCFIIYKATSEATDASSDDYYVSTEASVTMGQKLDIGIVSYITGTFSATLQNKSKKTIKINGNFQCPGIN
ncbi:MAG: hypothetical protein IKQ70_16755 [Bacteroidales bacterium]|nr:hypothetical protein [Bacteroidales bacterium]